MFFATYPMQLKNVLYNQFESHRVIFITITQFSETINNGQGALKKIKTSCIIIYLIEIVKKKKKQPRSQLVGNERVDAPNMEAQQPTMDCVEKKVKVKE